MPRITSWLKKPLMVLVAVVLVILGAGTAHAETTPPPSATTTAITEVIIPEKPPFDDPCNPVGVTSNIDWTGPLPADTDQINWTENAKGDVRTASLIDTANTQWTDGTVSPKPYRLVDSGVACEVPIVKVAKPSAPLPLDECNPVGVTSNIDWKDPLPADTAQINWTENAEGTVRTAALVDTEKTTWDDGSVAPLTFTLPADSGVACEVPIVKVAKPSAPLPLDECNPVGVTSNIDWKDPLPADTAQINWTENAEGTVRTAALVDTEKTTWDDGSVAPLTFTLPADSGVACEVPIVQTKAFVCKYVGMGANERLQTGNNPIMIDRKDDMVIGSFFGDAQKRSVVIGFGNPGDPDMPISACPAPPETPDPVVTVTTESRDNCELGYVQTRTVTTTRSYAWQGTDGWVLGDPVVSYGEWVNTDTPATGCEVLYLELAPLTVTATCGAVTFTNPAGNPAVAVYYGDFMQETPDGSVVVKPGTSVTVKTERTSLDGIVFAEGYYDLVFEDVVVEQKCATPVDPEPPVKPKPPVVAKPQPPAQPSEWVDTDDLVKPIIDAGVDTPATVTPMEAGSVFGTTAASIATATLLMLSVALAWRQRSKLAAVFTRR